MKITKYFLSFARLLAERVARERRKADALEHKSDFFDLPETASGTSEKNNEQDAGSVVGEFYEFDAPEEFAATKTKSRRARVVKKKRVKVESENEDQEEEGAVNVMLRVRANLQILKKYIYLFFQLKFIQFYPIEALITLNPSLGCFFKIYQF